MKNYENVNKIIQIKTNEKYEQMLQVVTNFMKSTTVWKQFTYSETNDAINLCQL